MTTRNHPRTRQSTRRGFALAYAFIVSTVFLVFFAALALSFRDSVRAVRFSEDSVKCRALADLGNELVYQLFLEHGLEFIPAEEVEPGKVFRLSNDPDSPYSFEKVLPAGQGTTALVTATRRDALGGTFTVSIEDARDQGLGVPDQGTFWTMSCVAAVNARETTVESTSRFLVKVGVPFVNYLKVGTGRFEVGQGQWNGPICAATSRTSGTPTIRIRATHTSPDVMTSAPRISQITNNMSGLLRCMGPIEFFHVDTTSIPETLTFAGLVPAGAYPAGSQILSTEPTGGPGTGEIAVESGGLTVEPHSGLPLRQDTIAEVLESVSNADGVKTLDVTGYPQGVLVEVNGTSVDVYKARLQSVGKIYDLAMVLSIFSTTKSTQDSDGARLIGIYGSSQNAMEAAVEEARWDDPAFPNEPYPAQLKLDIAQFITRESLSITPPEEGDYIDLKEVRRDGPPIEHYDIGAAPSWTILRIVATQLSAQGHDGLAPSVPVAPSVFFRGRVDGRLLVAYDLEGEAADLTAADLTPNLLTIVNAPSEDGLIPAGVRLADENVITEADSTEIGSDDMVMLAARGQVRAWSLPLYYADRVYQATGAAIDFQASEPPGTDWSKYKEGSTATEAEVFAVTVANLDSSLNNGLTADGRFEKMFGTAPDIEDGLMPRFNFSWDEVDPSGPLAIQAGRQVLPRRMRLCFHNRMPSYHLTGSRSSLLPGSGSSSAGHIQYDYRWRDLDAETLGKTMGLTVGPILIDRRGF